LGLAITTELKLGRLRIDADFLIRARFADSPCKDEHFFKPPWRFSIEKQTEEQKGSFDTQREK